MLGSAPAAALALAWISLYAIAARAAAPMLPDDPGTMDLWSATPSASEFAPPGYGASGVPGAGLPRAGLPGADRLSGDASLLYGSHNTTGAALRMQTPLGEGLHGFLALSAGGTDLGPGGRAAPHLNSQAGEVGLQKVFPGGTTVSLSLGWERSHLSGAQSCCAYVPVP